MAQLWGGRFKKETDQLVYNFNASITFDKRFYKQDIRGSLAHVAMLAKQGILTEEEKEQITDGLNGILKDVESGKLEISDKYEDIHSFVEATLIDRIGDPGKKLHTGRSRNDQVALDMKLFTRDEIQEIDAQVKELLEVSRKHGVSMSVFLTAAMICAIHEEQSKMQEKKPVILMVPVNLRKIFPSDSMLNFFSYIEPGYHFGEGKDSFDDVLEATKQYFEENLSKEKIAERMNNLIAYEKHKILKWAPLELKNRCIKMGAKLAEREVTAVLSNMSVVKMPPEYAKYIERFGVYTSTMRTELCVCSFGDTLSFAFTSRYDSTNIQRNFYRILKEQGIFVKKVHPGRCGGRCAARRYHSGGGRSACLRHQRSADGAAQPLRGRHHPPDHPAGRPVPDGGRGSVRQQITPAPHGAGEARCGAPLSRRNL